MISPTRVVPIKTSPAPYPVMRTAIPSQAFDPKTPALPKHITERKKRRDPTTTFGWPRTSLVLEIRNAKERNIKGKKIEAQEKYLRRKSLRVIKAAPEREKEIKISPAIAKKKI